jgi:beta-lactamase superfamily II metal-dependent hydrolase
MRKIRMATKKTANSKARVSTTESRKSTKRSNDFFTLEALNARHGDALLLHFGSMEDPRHILIDGGPSGVYITTVRPRLEELARNRGLSDLPLDHVFVTHLDSDHIRGILDLAVEMRDKVAPATSHSFWFNTFEDALAVLPPSAMTAAKAAGGKASLASLEAVTASVAEGQRLFGAVQQLAVAVNGGSGQLLLADGKGVSLPISPKLSVTLIGPNLKHMRALEKEWAKKAKPTKLETAAYADRSVYNLSSLVMVVEAKSSVGEVYRMLLTGDARGDHTLAALEASGFLDSEGRAHFDLLKVAHHGSERNYKEEFFEVVTAKHYVVSADGRFENPSETVLEWIGRHAPDGSKVHLTNRSGTGYTALDKNVAEAQKGVKRLREMLVFRSDESHSVSVHLLAPTPF